MATVIASAESVLAGGQVIVFLSKDGLGNAGDYIGLWEIGGFGQKVWSATPEQPGKRVFNGGQSVVSERCGALFQYRVPPN